MKTKMIFGLMMVSMLAFVSCNKDSVEPANLNLIVKSSNYTPPVKNGAAVNVTLTDVYVNILKIEFKLDESEYEHHHQHDTLVSEQEFEGPFALALMKDGILQSNDLGSVVIPPASYDKIEFKLDKNTTVAADHPLYNRSVYVAGTIDAMHFVVWQNSREEVEIQFPDSSVMAVGSDMFNLFIDFHLNKIMDGLLTSGLANAVDGNDNGIIEIGPDDTDGNNEIAYLIMHYFKHSCDLDNDDDNSNDDSNEEHHGGDN